MTKMTQAGEQLKNQIASLSHTDQIAIARYLWESIDSFEDPEWDRAWAAEAQRRSESAERGESGYVSAEEVHRLIRERLGRK